MRSIKVLKIISFICAQIKATVVYRFSFINQRRENKSALQTKTKRNISTMHVNDKRKTTQQQKHLSATKQTPTYMETNYFKTTAIFQT